MLTEPRAFCKYFYRTENSPRSYCFLQDAKTVLPMKIPNFDADVAGEKKDIWKY